jgi:Homeobox KN domain
MSGEARFTTYAIVCLHTPLHIYHHIDRDKKKSSGDPGPVGQISFYLKKESIVQLLESNHTPQIDTYMAEEMRRSAGVSGFSSGSCFGSGSGSNASTPRAPFQPRCSPTTPAGETDSASVLPLDEAAVLAFAELETPSTLWSSISPEITVITGGSMRLSPVASSAQPDARRALFYVTRRSSQPISTTRFAEASSPLNVDPSQRADNGKRNTSANRRRTLGLCSWCSAHWGHPYPDVDEKDELCNQYSMSRQQLDIW